MKTRPSIYQFTDYRTYLKAYYQFSKEHKNGFSYRAMSQQLGFTSPNYLKLIIDGDRHIGKNGIDKIATGLELKKLESEYFSYLVFFAKAKSEVDRNWYFGQIARLRNKGTSGNRLVRMGTVLCPRRCQASRREHGKGKSRGQAIRPLQKSGRPRCACVTLGAQG